MKLYNIIKCIIIIYTCKYTSITLIFAIWAKYMWSSFYSWMHWNMNVSVNLNFYAVVWHHNIPMFYCHKPNRWTIHVAYDTTLKFWLKYKHFNAFNLMLTLPSILHKFKIWLIVLINIISCKEIHMCGLLLGFPQHCTINAEIKVCQQQHWSTWCLATLL